MKKFITGRVPFLLIVIALAIFNVIFWPIVCSNGIANSKASVWVGYGFLTFSFCVCAACTFIRKTNKNVQVALLPLLRVTFIYLVLSIIFNIILMCVNTENWVWGVIIDAIMLLIYCAAFLITFKHFDRVNTNTKVREKRMKDWRLVAVSVSSLVSSVTDKEIKDALNKLYEHIKTSSSASNETISSSEEELEEQIITIKSLIRNEADKESILKAIRIAEDILRERNQKLLIR